jgi:L-rhamnose mutarotase
MHFDNNIKHVGSLIKVRPEYEERYIILHKHTFPGVLSQIHKVNIRNYSIFLLNGILFSHYEYIGQDYENDMKAIADETTKEWWKLTDPMQEPLSTRKPGEWWAEMKQFLCLDKFVLPSANVRRAAFKAEITGNNTDELEKLLTFDTTYMQESLNLLNLQNINFFFKDSTIYMYLEYTGVDFQQDIINLKQYNSFKSALENLSNLLSEKAGTRFHEMKEVFHTD